jgi:hypothetical protein
MKKMLVILLCMTVVCAMTAQAAVVYLKNGRVMTGRVVARDQEKIELKTGTGDAAVRTTIFLEDINRIETEDAYKEEIDLIPFELLSSKANESASGSFAFNTSVALKRFPSQKNVSADEVGSGKMLSENDRLEEPGPLPLPADIVPPWVKDSVVSGSISGIVRLPSGLIGKDKGDLYVFLMEDIGHKTFVEIVPWLYQKIDKKAIRTHEVAYQINHVPKNTYKVFVVWDIAAPPVEEKKTSKGVVLRKVERKGDYVGSSDESILLRNNENRRNVDIKGLDYVAKNAEIFIPLGERPNIAIYDIVYARKNLNEEKFEFIIKNEGEGESGQLVFDILINGEQISLMPTYVDSLRPDEERHEDLTWHIERYKEDCMNVHPDWRLPNRLKIQIIWNETQEVIYEKTISTLW